MSNDATSSAATITLDGQLVAFTPGETIYEIALRQGTFVPTLCYDPRLKPFGACRLCVVELKTSKNPVASCTTQATPGMEITTSSERIETFRKTLLEMLVSENRELDVSPLRSIASQELTLLVDRYAARTGRFQGAHSGQSRLDD
ncbi:MAG: 2Fe-2S iron-sulfur cluster-binding protein, partial [Roseiflexaceae bacterium]